jgi:hypothetical protein
MRISASSSKSQICSRPAQAQADPLLSIKFKFNEAKNAAYLTARNEVCEECVLAANQTSAMAAGYLC